MSIFNWKKNSDTVVKKKVETTIDGDYIYTYQDDVKGKEPGWRVNLREYRQEKDRFAHILSEVHGKPVNDISGLFRGCKNMSYAPEIPETIKYMSGAFENCSGLRRAPGIPKDVRDMRRAFAGCSSLMEPPMVSDTPAFISNMPLTIGCFEGCGFMKDFGDILIDEITDMSNGTYAGKIQMNNQAIGFHFRKHAMVEEYASALALTTKEMLGVILEDKTMNSQIAIDMLLAYSRYDELMPIIKEYATEATRRARIDLLEKFKGRIPEGYTFVTFLGDANACLLEGPGGQMMVLR